jgi:hypothetical protein
VTTPAGPIPPWTRPDTRATGRIADAMFVVLHRGPLADAPLSLRTDGAPSAEAVGVVDVSEITERAWLDGWRAGAIGRLAEGVVAPAALADADRCHLVRATVADPTDHVHVQAAWAIARWLARRGAIAVLDVFALRWHAADAVRAHDVAAPLDPEREVTIVAEDAAAAPGRPRVVHTRGLRKVGRPDVVALRDAEDAVDDVVAAVRAVAARLIDGWLPRDGDHAGLMPAPPPLADALGLQNDALLLPVATPPASN